nr:MAG: hypothetical protein 3 [Leviviridae sp.]
MKSPIELWQRVAIEYGDRCCACTTRDGETVASRWKTEGWPFLTVTLPAFGKDFERSLDLGQVVPSLFTGFAKRGETPKFLGEFLDRVFDRNTGLLVDHPDIESIAAVRQLTLMFAKIQVAPAPSREAEAWEKWWKTEDEVAQWSRWLQQPETLLTKRLPAWPAEDGEIDSALIGTLRKEFRYYAEALFGDVFQKVSDDIDGFNIVPKHGPGATAERTSANQKFTCREWPSRLDRVFPIVEYAIPSFRFIPELDSVAYPDPEDEQPVRVVSVPKDGRGPRLIAIEPVAMQYMQQGLLERFVEYLESDRLSGSFIGFSDQEPNRLLAEYGSRTGDLATLDLKDASDRVSRVHVQDLLRSRPSVLEGVEACRSTRALAHFPAHIQSRYTNRDDVQLIPEGDLPVQTAVKTLSKFASMGSALTFPLEAMVFVTIIFVALGRVEGRRLSRGQIAQYRGRVRVYGDDIIVPAESAPLVATTLELFGLSVNTHKSFWNGKFRESCGKEFYDGADVSIVRVRREFPSPQRDGWRREQALNLISLINLRNRFYYAGLWSTAGWLDSWIEPMVRYYPTVSPTSPVLGRCSMLGYETQRLSTRTHAPQVKGYVLSTVTPRDHLEGYGALMKWFLKRGEEPFANRDHLERHGRPDAVSIKLRWSQPF